MSTNEGNKADKNTFSPNRLLAIFLAVLLLVTVFIVVLTSGRSTKVWSVSSPQGVVQSYLGAIAAGNSDKAAQSLIRSSKCRVTDLDHVFITPGMRIFIKSANVSGASASVVIRVEYPSDGPLTDTTFELHTLRMKKVATGWRLVGIPWPLYECGVINK